MKRRAPPPVPLVGDVAAGPARYEKVSGEDLSVLVRRRRLRLVRGTIVVLH